MISASAPAKVILFGEHSVVYGRPAIAVPVMQVKAFAVVEPARAGRGVTILATDQARVVRVREAAPQVTLAAGVRQLLRHLDRPEPDANVTVHSTIPSASGMGSSAAVSTAIVRALAKYLGHDLDAATVSALVYEVEKLHHGTPSGIDNTVVAYEQPVYFVRGQPIQTFDVKQPFTIIIGNTGIHSPTRFTVGDVRKGWEADRDRYEGFFDQIGSIVERARAAIESGDVAALGPLMDANHTLLRQIDVSSAELDRLVDAAKAAGALGAKLVGAGRGGNMIALVDDTNRQAAEEALVKADVKGVIITKVE